MDYQKMTAPCGLDCFNCTLYLANTDEALKKKAAAKMKLAIDKVICQGCRNQNGTIPYLDMKEPCKVYQCIHKKGLNFCFECEDFPCDYLHPYADQASEKPHNLKVFNNCLIKKMGLEKWAREKSKNVKSTYFRKKWTI